MRRFFGIILAALVAALALVAKLFKGKADRLEAETRERDIRERETVAQIAERRAAVLREHLNQKAPDTKNRTDFE
jgi:hypothetical protein